MLSLGLKNAILVMLIILILHVLIKNAIIDHKPVKEKFQGSLVGAPVGGGSTKDYLEANKIPTPVPACPKPVEKKGNDKDDENELLKYVYGDDKETGDLSQYFKGMDITKDVKKEIAAKISCSAIKNDSLPLSTTCDPQLQSLTSDDVLLLKQKKPESQNISNMMLGEYEDENAMNGGALYGNLSAYDDMAFSFEDYKCESSQDHIA
jgi:hypothetical protein